MQSVEDVLKEDEKEGRKLSAKVSWFLQGIIRRWEFPVINVVFSLWFWTHFHLFGDPAVIWNEVYSLMAIVVESIVGIGMYSQASRDAKIIRFIALIEGRILGLEDYIKDTQNNQLTELRRHSSLLRQILGQKK